MRFVFLWPGCIVEQKTVRIWTVSQLCPASFSYPSIPPPTPLDCSLPLRNLPKPFSPSTASPTPLLHLTTPPCPLPAQPTPPPFTPRCPLCSLPSLPPSCPFCPHQVQYNPSAIQLPDIRDAIVDMGFEASLVVEPRAQEGVVRLVVRGMTCASCVGAVERAALSLSGESVGV